MKHSFGLEPLCYIFATSCFIAYVPYVFLVYPIAPMVRTSSAAGQPDALSNFIRKNVSAPGWTGK